MPKQPKNNDEKTPEDAAPNSRKKNKNGAIELPDVAKMNGLILTTGAKDIVEIQYEDASQNLHALRLPLGDAMYLLSLLKGLQLDMKIPFPDDPRGYKP